MKLLIISMLLSILYVNKGSDMRNYELSVDGYEELCDYEGFSPTPYIDDVGVKTVGFGATKSDIPDLDKWPWDKEISLEEGLRMLKQHSKSYADAVNRKLDVDISQHQFDALVAITYNIGKGGMSGSTFMRWLNMGKPASKIAEAMMMWNKGKINGRMVVIKGLTNRRKAEGLLFQTGHYNNDRKCTLIKVNPRTHKPIYSGVVDLAPYLS